MGLRKELLDLGVIDIVLLCLAQYAQQTPRSASLHGEDKGKSAGKTSSADALAKFFSAIQSKSRAYFGNVAIDRSLARVEQFYSVQAAKPKGPPAVMKATSYPVANYWEKGTGYGTGSTQSSWNAQQTAAQLRSNELLVSTLFDLLTAFMVLDIKEGVNGEAAVETVVSARFMKMLYRSCVHKALQAYLLNDSVMDISNRTDLYRSVLKFVTALCPIPQELRAHRNGTPSTATESAASKKQDLVVDILNGTSSPVVQLLEKFIHTIDAYLGRLQQASNPKPAAVIKKKATKAAVPEGSGPVTRRFGSNKRSLDQHTDFSRANPGKDAKDPQKEPAPGASSELLLTQVLENAKQALNAVKKRVPHQEKADEPSTSASAAKAAKKTAAATPAVPEKTPTELYVGGLGPLQFDSILFFEDDGKTIRFPFYYTNQLENVGSATNMAKRTRRLAQELVTLQTSLPLTLGSSVFIRASEERLDVLITGPAATPYSNGCFEFDVHFPKNYPDVPMMVTLTTTGNGSVRFNPNLYNDGKVCLSLLNTWSGRPEERWSSNSSLLQVLVSIQSLIFVGRFVFAFARKYESLVEDPFFNEPGFERYRGQPFGDKETRRYNTNIQNECVRWAMLEQLRKPSKAFEEVTRRHFWLKRDEICEQVQAWIADLERYISEVPSTSDPNNTTVFPSRLAALKKNFEDLKTEMRKMKAPQGLENVRSKQFDQKVEVIELDLDDEPGPSGVQRGKKRTSRTPGTPMPKAKAKKVAC
ncbi:baculoviral IAP repeat-containing protein 6-like isoform X4 [Aphelenchoides avenae]|nr:baculoviral IAP repeat-containing protein 6-like isoform X4 [Aphelenchus avenae]